MSLFADYQKERFGWYALELEGGFVFYDIKPPEASVEELYVVPEMRGTSLYKRLCDHVYKHAKEAGCKRVWSSVTPAANGSTRALRSCLAYGSKLSHVQGTDIILVKEID